MATKVTIFSFSFFILLINLLSNDSYFPVCKNDKWGYINELKQLVINYKFVGGAFPFYYGYAAVEPHPSPQGETYFFIDKNGNYLKTKKVVDIKGNEIENSERFKDRIVNSSQKRFLDGYLPYMGGVVDLNGNFIVSPHFIKYVRGFHQGLAPALIGDKWGFIDTNWKVVIKPKFTEVSNMLDGMALAEIGEKKGYINKEGTFYDFSEYDCLRHPSEGFAFITRFISDSNSRKKWFCVNRNGEIVFSIECNEVGFFSEGLASIFIRGYDSSGWGFINQKGDIVIKTKLNRVGNFSEGLAVIDSGNKILYINKKGIIKIEIKLPGGNEKILYPFENGFARIDYFYDQKEMKTWYINKKGDFFWGPENN